MNEGKIGRITKEYKLPYIVAKYLSERVVESKDHGEYETHKRVLQKLCHSGEEFVRADKCLIDTMGI